MNKEHKIISSFIFLLFYAYIFEISLKNKEHFNNYIIYNNYAIQNINNLIKARKVVYTVLLGKYDKVTSIKKEKGFDYFLITDQFIEKEFYLNWSIIHIEEKLNFSDYRGISKKQRYYKLNPHLFFKDYNLSIYIDSTFSIKGNLSEFLLRILTKNKIIYILEHPYRNSITNEYKEILLTNKDTNITINKVKNKYKKENFPDNNGLSENCLIVRRHNEVKCIEFMNKWFNEIKFYSHRDQLSFNYILWKTGNQNVKYISKNFILNYFVQKIRHLKEIKF